MLNHSAESISHLRIHRLPPSLASLKRLRFLQLGVKIEQIRTFFGDLILNKPMWPRLKHIEFLTPWMERSEEEVKSVINEFRDSYQCDTSFSIQLVRRWRLKVPEDGLAMCRDDFPCYSW